MDKQTEISKEMLIADIKKAGIQKGDILNLKISLKSIGWVQGGARTVIDAFLHVVGDEGTLITDSFVSVKPYRYLKKNIYLTHAQTPSYAGAIANAMLAYPQVRRSNHPIQKFAILGKYADKLANNHSPDDYAYDVLRRMTEMGGKKVRIGFPGKTKGLGTCHLAIGELGLQQKRLKYGVHYLQDNQVKLFLINWAGGCEEGFNRLIPQYEKQACILYQGKVGNGEIIVTDMKKTFDWEVAAGKQNPKFFFCSNPACIDCRLTWKFSTGKLLKVVWENIRRKRFGHALYAVLVYFKGIYQPEKQ